MSAQPGWNARFVLLALRGLLRLRRTLALYIAGGHRRSIQERPHHGLEPVLGDFDGFGHGTIVRPPPSSGPMLMSQYFRNGIRRIGLLLPGSVTVRAEDLKNPVGHAIESRATIENQLPLR